MCTCATGLYRLGFDKERTVAHTYPWIQSVKSCCLKTSLGTLAQLGGRGEGKAEGEGQKCWILTWGGASFHGGGVLLTSIGHPWYPAPGGDTQLRAEPSCLGWASCGSFLVDPRTVQVPVLLLLLPPKTVQHKSFSSSHICCVAALTLPFAGLPTVSSTFACCNQRQLKPWPGPSGGRLTHASVVLQLSLKLFPLPSSESC